ncbi:DUF302 domain-containing protein [Natronorubrum daqingense]|uniref:Uncharacterized conserved protein, DUF302 family n=1 Tax=Natronorubrum daqingense TaxID=588898 RepID=A0A1N7BXP5_9EURY|nr:DUF302 domain-containing protein [Natronorubrum daqingense]APX96642.1 hypothetical protein BB347_08445 [Natronorubrum daqingense]SIR56127.1 Uncharacterized conserved protein, DUF302 family [Natronorubrum daqingense]
MSLPIDPAAIDPDDFGEKQAVLEMDHEEAIEHVREVCENVGFGIPVEFSPSELLNEKVDADRDPYYVLGACNPEIANQALDETMKIGGLFPCNVIVWEEEPGRQRVYHVSIMKIAQLLGTAPENDAWDDILDQTGELTEEAFERFDAVETTVSD